MIRMKTSRTGLALALLALPAAGLAQSTEAPVDPVPTEAVAAPVPAPQGEPANAEAVPAATTIPAGTLIEIRIDTPINSRDVKSGDWYSLSLSQPIMLGDQTVIPAGAPGRGQVVHAAKSSWGGKAGELILAARYIEHDGHRIDLRGMKLGGVGKSNETLAMAASMAATPLAFAINGKNADVPEGTLATAKLVAELDPAKIATPPVTAVAATPDSAAPTPEASPTGTAVPDAQPDQSPNP